MIGKKYITPVLLGICLAIGIYTLNYARTRHLSTSQTKQELPFTREITSCAKGVRVVKADIVNPGTHDAMIELQTENLTDLDIIAISMESVRGDEAFATLERSLSSAKEQTVIIKAHQVATLSTSQGGFIDVPLRIGLVVYADGTEEGCESSLETLHQLREHDQEKEIPHP